MRDEPLQARIGSGFSGEPSRFRGEMKPSVAGLWGEDQLAGWLR